MIPVKIEICEPNIRTFPNHILVSTHLNGTRDDSRLIREEGDWPDWVYLLQSKSRNWFISEKIDYYCNSVLNDLECY